MRKKSPWLSLIGVLAPSTVKSLFSCLTICFTICLSTVISLTTVISLSDRAVANSRSTARHIETIMILSYEDPALAANFVAVAENIPCRLLGLKRDKFFQGDAASTCRGNLKSKVTLEALIDLTAAERMSLFVLSNLSSVQWRFFSLGNLAGSGRNRTGGIYQWIIRFTRANKHIRIGIRYGAATPVAGCFPCRARCARPVADKL